LPGFAEADLSTMCVKQTYHHRMLRAAVEWSLRATFSLPVLHPKGKFLGGLRTTEESAVSVCIDANIGSPATTLQGVRVIAALHVRSMS
jgi:hypothetical protein